MEQATVILEALRQRVAQRGFDNTWPLDREYFAFAAGEYGMDVWFYGEPMQESYGDLLACLNEPPVSACLSSISLSGPDTGTNGTRNWDLEPLAEGPALFERLDLLSIQLTQPGDHNRTIVGSMYEENGVIARVLKRAPKLRTLQVPSAPDATFFEVAADNLECLSIDAGYATQDFILNLAKSSNLPALRSLEWGDYHETYMDNWRSLCTPLAHYRELVSSAAFRNVSAWVLRNPGCSDAEISEIKASRPNLQILVVRTSSEYA